MTRRRLAAVVLGGLLLLATPPLAAAELQSSLTDRYRQALTADPDNPTLHYLLGVALLETAPAEALEALRRAYPAYRDNLEANFNLSLACLKINDFDAALLYFDQAETLGIATQTEIYPAASLAYNLALKALETGQDNEAIRLFHRVLAFDPERSEVYRQLGGLYARRGDSELAFKAFRQHLAAVPDDPISRDFLFALEFNRAQEAWHNGDLAAAEQGFRRAFDVRPDHPAVLYYLGNLAYRRQQPEAAVPLLQQAFPAADHELRQALRPLLYNCALALRDAGRMDAAVNAALTLAAQPDADVQELFLAASLCIREARYLEGKTLLERLLQLEPGHVGALKHLITAEKGVFTELLGRAREAIDAGDLTAAAEALAGARAFHPTHSRVTQLENQLQKARLALAADAFATARQALAEGRLAAAGEAWRKGLAVCPDDPDGRQLRAQSTREFTAARDLQLSAAATALSAGRWREATEIYAAVLVLEPDNGDARTGLETSRQRQSEAINRLLARGRQALQEGEADLARDLFQELLDLDPDNTEAAGQLTAAGQRLKERSKDYLQQGRRAASLGKLAEARALFEKARQVDDDGLARGELTRLDQAAAERVGMLVRRAAQAAKQGDYRQADQFYGQALALQPGYEEARRGRQELVARRDAAVRDSLARGDEALRRDELPAALRAYRAAFDLAPDNSAAQAGLQRIRQRQAEQLSRLVAQGDQAFAGGDLTAAGRAAELALGLDPYHPGAIRLRDRIEQARLRRDGGGDEQSLYLQGVALYTKGSYAEAISAWETVLTVNPGHDKARQNIDKTRRKLRQIEEYRGG